MKTTMLTVVAALLLSGCLTTNAVLLDPRVQYAPVSPGEVVIYLTEEDVPYEYEAIALVHAKGEHEVIDEAEMVEAMREKAAELGADAIILSWLEEPSSFERLLEGVFPGADADRRGRAVAIRWLNTRERRGR